MKLIATASSPLESHDLRSTTRWTSRLSKSPGLGVIALVLSGLFATCFSAVGQTTIILGAAQNFTILGASTVTNTGATIINGNLGLSPGTSVTGFPPGMVVSGSIRINDALANQAHGDAFSAYTQLAGEVPTINLTGMDLGGLTLVPGVYRFDSLAQLTGTLSLDTGGDPNAPFHFQIGSTLTTASSSAVVLLGLSGASDPNIFWQVGSSAIIGSATTFVGTILANQSITFNTGATLLDGRALAINGAVTLDTNTFGGTAAAIATGRYWTGASSNLWSGANWSPDASGTSSSTLAPDADVVFSSTGLAPQNQNTVLDYNATISSLTINDPNAVTISGPFTLSITGSGAAAGILVNSGAGLTTINSGLELGDSSQGITVNNTAGLVINGAISGTSGLTKGGSGQLTLNVANTYTGVTTVGAGTLEVDGSIVGNTLVSGGTLRGVGTIGGNVVNNAAVRPGRVASIGTLSIAGTYTQNATGILGIRIVSSTDYDRLAIGGSAALNGALSVTYPDGYNARTGDEFTILTAAAGVSGRFSEFSDEHATGTVLKLRVVYEDNDVLLRFIQGSFTDTSTTQLTPSQLAVANALDQLASSNPDDKLIQELNRYNLGDLPDGFRLLSAEDFAAIFTVGLAVSQIQVGNIERRLTDVRQGATGFSDSRFAATDSHGSVSYDGKSAVAHDGKSTVNRGGKDGKDFIDISDETSNRWGFFISGTGEFGDLESTGAARGSSFMTGGVTIGADYRVNNQFVLGVAVGYANTSSDLANDGELDLDSGKASLYGTWYQGGFYVNGMIGAGIGSYDTKRRTIGGFAHGNTDSTDYNGLLGTGYDHRIGAFTLGPIASMQYCNVGVDGFTEHGALGALRIDSQSQDSLKSAIGMRASYSRKLGRIVLTPEIRAQWQHEYLTNHSSIEGGFTSRRSFTMPGPRIGRDALLLDIGTSVALTSDVAIFAFYTGELGRENYTVHSVTGGLRVSF